MAVALLQVILPPLLVVIAIHQLLNPIALQLQAELLAVRVRVQGPFGEKFLGMQFQSLQTRVDLKKLLDQKKCV